MKFLHTTEFLDKFGIHGSIYLALNSTINFLTVAASVHLISVSIVLAKKEATMSSAKNR